MFQLTDGQAKAFDICRKLVKQPTDRPRIMVLRGYAGTGKSTLVKYIANELGELASIAPTGKAATRITEISGLPASTIHRYIYSPKEDPLSGNVRFSIKNIEEIHRPSSGLIVLDEASMVGGLLWDDIYKVATQLNCHLLAVGDPFQLPPVELESEKTERFGLLLPDFRFDYEANLTEITRQALENPIIRCSMLLRKGDTAEAVMGLKRIAPADLLQEHLTTLKDNGVVICHKNQTRQILNAKIREHLQYSPKDVISGEPLLVLRNNYSLNRFNGEVLKFDGWKRPPGKQFEIYDRWRQTADHSSYGIASVEGEECSIATAAVRGGLEGVSVNAVEVVSKTAVGKHIPYLHCNFGYTLTAHKSQGSEWKKVVVVVENSVKPYTWDGARWIYTALTRSREDVSIVWMPSERELGYAR